MWIEYRGDEGAPRYSPPSAWGEGSRSPHGGERANVYQSCVGVSEAYVGGDEVSGVAVLARLSLRLAGEGST